MAKSSKRSRQFTVLLQELVIERSCHWPSYATFLVWKLFPVFPERYLRSGIAAIPKLCSVGRVNAYSRYSTQVHANGNDALLRRSRRKLCCLYVDESMT